MSTDPYAAELMAEVFDYSPITKHILAEAKIRMVSPWSLLGSCLGQAAIATPYNVLIPAIVGTPASLNPLMVGVGASGAGKGISSARVLNWPAGDPFALDDGEQVLTDAFTPLTPGSGEGISALFKENRSVPGLDGKGKITVPVVIRRAAWISYPEVDQVAAISSRVGSTAMSEIRKCWSGEPLGTLTKVKANQLMVEAHSYRAVIVVAAQPLRCGPLLEEEAGGTLQRVLWLSADDPDLEDRDEETSVLDVELPDFHAGISTPGPTGPTYYFQVDPTVRREIRQDRAAGKWKGTEDSHRNLVRLKVAAAGAVLHGSLEVTPEIWAWAGAIVEHSVRVRASVRADVEKAAHEANSVRALTRGRNTVTEASARDMLLDKVSASIERGMARPKHAGKALSADGIRKAFVAPADRSLVPDAIALLVGSGALTPCGENRVGFPTYALATGEQGTGETS